MINIKRPTYLDLFSGAGGFSVGLEAARFRVLGSIEIDSVAAKSFSLNFPDAKINRHGPSSGDIRKVCPRQIMEEIKAQGETDLDMIVAAPPCQGFSRVGRGKLKSLADKKRIFFQDDRNQLYRQAINFLKVLRPKVILFENVAGMLHLGGVNMAEVVCDEINAQGYSVKCALLNSSWYGVPQIRERVFIIGFRKDLGISPEFPPIQRDIKLSRGHLSHAELDPHNWENSSYFVPYQQLHFCPDLKPAVTVCEAFSGLPPFTMHMLSGYKVNRATAKPVDYLNQQPQTEYDMMMRNWDWSDRFKCDFAKDHISRHTPRDFRIFARMKHGDKYPAAVEIAHALYEEAVCKYLIKRESENVKRPLRKDYVPPYKLTGFPDKWRKLSPEQPSWTITAHLGKDTYSHIHYDSKQARMITMREAARLQSFPDGFQFSGNMGDVFRQIGNAVPPLMAKAIGDGIFEQLAAHSMAANLRPTLKASQKEAPYVR